MVPCPTRPTLTDSLFPYMTRLRSVLAVPRNGLVSGKNANLYTMPPRLREGALTDDDRMLYLMAEISRGARRAYDARITKIGLNQTQWRIIGQLLREPSLTQAGIAKRLELESATIGQEIGRAHV